MLRVFFTSIRQTWSLKSYQSVNWITCDVIGPPMESYLANFRFWRSNPCICDRLPDHLANFCDWWHLPCMHVTWMKPKRSSGQLQQHRTCMHLHQVTSERLLANVRETWNILFLKDIWPTPVTNKIIYALNSKQKIDKANNAIQLRDDAWHDPDTK